MKTYKRKSVFVNLPPPLFKDHDFVEVTEWANGEGYDITVSDNPVISLHEVEFEYIKKLIEHLNS